jgi:hypothetical protein
MTQTQAAQARTTGAPSAAPAAASPALSPEELETLHASDVQAGRVIVMLLMGIFTIGLLMYTWICFAVM